MEYIDFPVASLKHKTKDFDLHGQGGNAFAVMAVGKGWLRELGLKDLEKQFFDECMSSDYESLLATMDKWFDTELADAFLDEWI